MATQDHKARACRSVPSEPKSPSTLTFDRPLYPLDPVQETQQTYASRLAGTSLAFVIIEGLLEYNEAFQRAQARGAQPKLHPWPLTPAQASGLHAAIHFLRHYVELLRHEPGG